MAELESFCFMLKVFPHVQNYPYAFNLILGNIDHILGSIDFNCSNINNNQNLGNIDHNLGNINHDDDDCP